MMIPLVLAGEGSAVLVHRDSEYFGRRKSGARRYLFVSSSISYMDVVAHQIVFNMLSMDPNASRRLSICDLLVWSVNPKDPQVPGKDAVSFLLAPILVNLEESCEAVDLRCGIQLVRPSVLAAVIELSGEVTFAASLAVEQIVDPLKTVH